MMKGKGARKHYVRKYFEHVRALRIQNQSKQYELNKSQTVIFVIVLVPPDAAEHYLETLRK